MLEKIKLLLDIQDTTQDSKLNLIIQTVTSRLSTLLGGISPPESLNYIIIEVSLIRFNKIGSEGITSHSVEGESLNFSDDNDFAEFKNDIQAYLDTQVNSTKGKVRFL